MTRLVVKMHGVYMCSEGNVIYTRGFYKPGSTWNCFGGLRCLQTFIYLAGLQLLLSGGLPSVVAGAAGVIAGLVYRSNLLGIRKWVPVGGVDCVLCCSLAAWSTYRPWLRQLVDCNGV